MLLLMISQQHQNVEDFHLFVYYYSFRFQNIECRKIARFLGLHMCIFFFFSFLLLSNVFVGSLRLSLVTAQMHLSETHQKTISQYCSSLKPSCRFMLEVCS